MTILRSTGPVISTRRSLRCPPGSARRSSRPSRIARVSGRKSGSLPASNSRLPRARASRAARRGGRRTRAAAWRRTRRPPGVRICAYSGVMRPVISMPGPYVGCAHRGPRRQGRDQLRRGAGRAPGVENVKTIFTNAILPDPRAARCRVRGARDEDRAAPRRRCAPRTARGECTARAGRASGVARRRTSGRASIALRDAAIDRAHHRAQRRRDDVGVEADAVDRAGRCRCAAARRRPPSRPRRRRSRARGSSARGCRSRRPSRSACDERVDRAVAGAVQRPLGAVDAQAAPSAARRCRRRRCAARGGRRRRPASSPPTYSRSNAARISADDSSLPVASVICWITWLNSICSRRGSARP